MNFLNRSGKIILGCIALVIIGGPLFWMAGGVHWLNAKVFPPTRPRFMPVNSVWIDAPHLAISWHHGWWFGCGLSSSGATNYCRLVAADGKQVYGGEYLPCSSSSPIGEASVRLVAPPDSADMWLFAEENDGVIGFLADRDLLLPLSVRGKCNQVKARLRPALSFNQQIPARGNPAPSRPTRQAADSSARSTSPAEERSSAI